MLLNANTKKENSTDIHIITQHTESLEDSIHETGALSWGVQTALFLHHYLQKQLYSNSEKTNKQNPTSYFGSLWSKSCTTELCLGAWVSNTVSHVVQAVLVTQKPLMCWD